MNDNQWIRFSQKVYSSLLNLYPAKHRVEYGPDMLQLFSDQCRDCFQEGKGYKLVALWFQTIWDLIKTVIKEQLSIPLNTTGLLEAVPNSPLPWKGVLLVLIPGLIFFVSQIGQLVGKDWFYIMVYRAGYVLIFPVLLVWIWKRTFPIWGLVPLGLFLRTFFTFLWEKIQYLQANSFSPFTSWLNQVVKISFPELVEYSAIAIILLYFVVIIWVIQKSSIIPHSSRMWMGIFAAAVMLEIIIYIFNFDLATSTPREIKDTILDSVYLYGTYYDGGYLAIILAGALLARRHGRLALLMPLGFLLPTVIYGRVSNTWPEVAAPGFGFMLAVAAAALSYRFIVALAAPVWITRSATGRMQKKAEIVSLVIMLAIPLAFNVGMIFLTDAAILHKIIMVLSTLLAQTVIGAGLAIAITMYEELSESRSLVGENSAVLNKAS